MWPSLDPVNRLPILGPCIPTSLCIRLCVYGTQDAPDRLSTGVLSLCADTRGATGFPVFVIYPALKLWDGRLWALWALWALSGYQFIDTTRHFAYAIMSVSKLKIDAQECLQSHGHLDTRAWSFSRFQGDGSDLYSVHTFPPKRLWPQTVLLLIYVDLVNAHWPLARYSLRTFLVPFSASERKKPRPHSTPGLLYILAFILPVHMRIDLD